MSEEHTGLPVQPFQIAILKTIEAADGQLSWYQIDRALTQRGIDPGAVSDFLMTALLALQRDGLVSISNGHDPAQPLYSVTASGRQRLEISQ